MNTTPKNSKRWKRIATAFSILAVGIAAMAILAATKEEAKKKDVTQRVRKVDLTTLEYGDHTLQIHGNGTIQSQQTVNLVSLVGGEVVYSKNNLKSGLAVSKNEVLLRVDSREATNRTRQARSGLINAIVSLIPELKGNANTATYEKWNRYLERLDMNTTPELPEVTDPQERIRVSMHNIFNMHATVKNAEITLDRHTIRAPFNGYLLNDGALAGAWISPGQVAVSIIDPYQLEIAVPLALSELDLLPNDTTPTARVYPTEDHSKYLTGVLNRQNAHIDKHSQTVTIHVELQNSELDPAFLPGNYMDVYIQGTAMRNVAMLPRDVIAPGSFLFTFEDSLLARHSVEVVATEGDSVLIAPGELYSGMQIVTTMIQNPIVGMRIAPFESEDPDALTGFADSSTY